MLLINSGNIIRIDLFMKKKLYKFISVIFWTWYSKHGFSVLIVYGNKLHILCIAEFIGVLLLFLSVINFLHSLLENRNDGVRYLPLHFFLLDSDLMNFLCFPEVPEVPYGLRVLDKSGRSVQLSWAAPYDGNSPIKRYLIEYKISRGESSCSTW